MSTPVHIPTPSNRVKVYELCKDEWTDKGTGYCSGQFVNDNKDPVLIVRNENNRNEILLLEYIRGEIQFQKQQETLIVWSEPDKNDMALSFQEPEGCSIVCDYLVYVQKTVAKQITIMAVMSTDDGEMTEIIAGPLNYPPDPSLDNLKDIISSINQLNTYPFSRESLFAFISETDFVKNLVRVFEQAEKLHMITELHLLCQIVKLLCMFLLFYLFTSFFI